MYSRISIYLLLSCLCLLTLLAACSHSSITRLPQAQTQFKILGINDFHGQVPHIQNQGGLYSLASHLLKEIESTDSPTFILHGGDHVGASPAQSALLQDEPAIDFLNELQRYCNERKGAACHILGTAGNHEFDEGSAEMLRLLQGGNHANGPFLETKWKGSNYQTLSANVRDRYTNELLLPPYAIHTVNGIDVGFIGITLDSTPKLVIPGSLDNLTFVSQTQAVNEFSQALLQKGIKAQVLIIHDGAQMDFYAGPTQNNQSIPSDSAFYQFIQALPEEIDLVVSGHSHNFTNVSVNTKLGKSVLITQAFSSARAYAEIQVSLNNTTGDIDNTSATIVRTPSAYRGNLSQGAQHTLKLLASIVSDSKRFVQQLTEGYLNTFKPQNDGLALGQFIADSHKYAQNTDLGVMNKGGVRAKLREGKVTWGDMFAIQPFSNQLIVKEYTGAAIKHLVQNGSDLWSTNLTQHSDNRLSINGKEIEDNHRYSVAGNEYVMNSKGFADGKLTATGGKDVDATVDYIKRLPTPFDFTSTTEK
jgi:5'-nucleotidase